MPFAFIYVAALALWLFVACVIWGAAVLLLIIPRVRSIAWPMSLATATTFPFVFAYQLMAIPAIIFILLAAFALWRILEPVSAIKNPIVIGGFVFAIVVSGIVMLVASVAGLADGWRTGWGLARGRTLNEMFSQALPRIYLDRLLSRLRR